MCVSATSNFHLDLLISNLQHLFGGSGTITPPQNATRIAHCAPGLLLLCRDVKWCLGSQFSSLFGGNLNGFFRKTLPTCTVHLPGCLAVIQMCGNWVAFVGIRNLLFLYHFMLKTWDFREKPTVSHLSKNGCCTLENNSGRLSENSTGQVSGVSPTNTSTHDENYLRSAALLCSYALLAWREQQSGMRESQTMPCLVLVWGVGWVGSSGSACRSWVWVELRCVLWERAKSERLPRESEQARGTDEWRGCRIEEEGEEEKNERWCD